MKRFGVGGGEIESINVANVLMLLSQSAAIEEGDDHVAHSHASTSSSPSPERVFECKTCCRRFPSFQALGGHRASHKKPRVASGHGQALDSGAVAKPRVHECSVCGLEFAIGQALGGHMRRHRTAAEGLIAGQGIGEKKPLGGGGGGGGGLRGGIVMIDLNLPPQESDLKLGIGLEIVDKIPEVGFLH